MQQIQLHKVLVDKKDYNRYLRAMYSEDTKLLSRFSDNLASGLDLCVKDTLNKITYNFKMYKVEMPDGTLAGFFIDGVPLIKYLRVVFRLDVIETALTKLIISK